MMNESKKKSVNFFELSENKNIIQWNFYDTLKADLWGKFIVMNANAKKEKSERAQVNDTDIQLKMLKKQND